MKAILLNFFDLFVFFYNILLLIRIVLSWIVVDWRSNWLTVLILELTEPLLSPIRRILPKTGPLDLSPLALLLILQLIHYLVYRFFA